MSIPKPIIFIPICVFTNMIIRGSTDRTGDWDLAIQSCFDRMPPHARYS
jgi:hypothetical protein